MVDLSRLMQDAAILEVIDKSADEASNLSAQNSYQAMRIEELERDLAAANAKLAVLQAPQDVAGLTFAWTATEPQSNFPSYINAAYADDGSLRVAIRGKAHLDDEGEGPGFSAVVVLPSRVASDFFYALGALSIESIAANAKLAALQVKPNVAGLVERLRARLPCFPEPIEWEAADALLSLSAQLAEANETWTDEKGTCWTRPTAWAYAQSCRVMHEKEAECEAYREDAERYRWLRKNGNSFYNCIHYQGIDAVLDSNVDAARSHEQT